MHSRVKKGGKLAGEKNKGMRKTKKGSAKSAVPGKDSSDITDQRVLRLEKIGQRI